MDDDDDEEEGIKKPPEVEESIVFLSLCLSFRSNQKREKEAETLSLSERALILYDAQSPNLKNCKKYFQGFVLNNSIKNPKKKK